MKGVVILFALFFVGTVTQLSWARPRNRSEWRPRRELTDEEIAPGGVFDFDKLINSLKSHVPETYQEASDIQRLLDEFGIDYNPDPDSVAKENQKTLDKYVVDLARDEQNVKETFNKHYYQSRR